MCRAQEMVLLVGGDPLYTVVIFNNLSGLFTINICIVHNQFKTWGTQGMPGKALFIF